MHILLPPSEGKTPPESTTTSLDLDNLLAPGLNAAREEIMEALRRMCVHDAHDAAAQLKLGKKLHHYLDVNQRLHSAPVAPAWQVYTGVLFDALGYGDLTDGAQGRVIIFSGLWGVLRPDDVVPDYRCPAQARLPDLDTTAGTFWRRRLRDILPDMLDADFVLDLRSQEYAGMWRPTGPHATVRVVHETTTNGNVTRAVVSHFNKATKGRLARDLLSSGDEPTSLEDLVDSLRALKYRVEVPGPNAVDVITTEL